MLTSRFRGVACTTCAAALALVLAASEGPATAAPPEAGTVSFEDAFGQVRTLDVNGRLDPGNPFFQPLGTNGRSCVTCHEPGAVDYA